MKKFKMGTTKTDKITGFTGVITEISDYLTGCRQYCLQPRLDKDGVFVDAMWFDEDRLTKGKKFKVERPGGPQKYQAKIK